MKGIVREPALCGQGRTFAAHFGDMPAAISSRTLFGLLDRLVALPEQRRQAMPMEWTCSPSGTLDRTELCGLHHPLPAGTKATSICS